jgi:hypothetical protein
MVNTFRHLKKKFEESKAIVNGIRDEVKAEKQAAEKELEQNKIDNKELLMYMAAKQKGNEVKTKTPKTAVRHAQKIMAEINKNTIKLNIVPVDLKDLKNGTIVQVMKKAGKQVFIQYYTFEGITEAGKVKVFNGQEEVEYDPEIFNNAYTGLTFNIINPVKEGDITEINSVTSKIRHTTIQMLKDKLRHHQNNINVLAITALVLALLTVSLISVMTVLGVIDLIYEVFHNTIIALLIAGSIIILLVAASVTASIIKINKAKGNVQDELNALYENRQLT